MEMARYGAGRMEKREEEGFTAFFFFLSIKGPEIDY